MPFVVKLVVGEDIRRLVIETGTYEELNQRICNLFPDECAFPFKVKYSDEEGDLITIGSTAELKSAFDSLGNTNAALKLWIFPTNKTLSMSETSAPPMLGVELPKAEEIGNMIPVESVTPKQTTIRTEPRETAIPESGPKTEKFIVCFPYGKVYYETRDIELAELKNLIQKSIIDWNEIKKRPGVLYDMECIFPTYPEAFLDRVIAGSFILPPTRKIYVSVEEADGVTENEKHFNKRLGISIALEKQSLWFYAITEEAKKLHGFPKLVCVVQQK